MDMMTHIVDSDIWKNYLILRFLLIKGSNDLKTQSTKSKKMKVNILFRPQ